MCQSKRSLRSKPLVVRIAFLLLACAAVNPAWAQLQWSSYDNNGNFIAANVATGGDATYGGSVNLSVPAGAQRVFITKSFVPLSIAAASSKALVDFNFSANGALYPGEAGRIFGMGLLNDVGAASEVDDTGYWSDFNTGNPSFELFYRLNSVTTFFQYDSTHKLGSGTIKTGEPTNSTTYAMQFQVNMNSSANSVSIGTSTAWANCGAGMTNLTGPGVMNDAYSSGLATSTLATTTFNEFAFSFLNQSASAVTVTLSGITLVPANPVLTSQPLGYSGSPGDTTPTTCFAVTLNANSAPPLSYQWYQATSSATNLVINGATEDGSTISGATNSNLVFTSAQVADSASYYVVVTNAYGSVTSSPAILNIAASATAPAITAIAPTTATVIAGNGTNILVTATGAPSPVYFWYDNNSNLVQSGASPILVLTNVQYSGLGTYSVIASNSVGTASTNFVINVIVTPSISSQPTNLLLNVGDPATFSVAASGVPSPTYQWFKGAAAISNATNSSYSIGGVALTDIGNYSVVVSNQAGVINSSNAVLAIYSTSITATPLSPANGAASVCYDTPLTLSFNQLPTVGSTGKIFIYNSTNNSTPVDTLDLSAGYPQSRTIAGDTFNTYPVLVHGTSAVIYPHLDLLTSNQTYYVTWQAGVFLDTNGAYISAMSATDAWQFTTKASGPTNPTNLTVAADGTGDFATVQGAVDSVASGNTTPTVINVQNGFYQEIVDIHSRNNLLFRGQSRSGTIIGYANNNSINGSTHYRMAVKVNANDIAFDNLTVTNMTVQDFSQAEALMIETGAARVIVNNCNVDSYQDTILANASTSQAYFKNNLIQGDVDFIWGGGNLFLTNCEVRWLIRSNNTAALGPNPSPTTTDINSNGFSFVNCALTTLPGANPADTVGRTRSITNGNTVLIGCFVSTNIGGWFSDASPTSLYRNWFYDCTNDFGSSVTLSNGVALTASDVRVINASSASIWLNGWQPQLTPNILTSPASQTVTSGAAVAFSVVATGIPDPTYQWYLNGTNLNEATNAVLTIPDATSANAGSYYVIVTTTAGSATSASATLTVNSAPVFTTPIPGTNFTINAGVNLVINCTATDSDTPPPILAFSLLTGPAGSAVDSASGNFTWRPTIAQGNSVNPVSIVVTDTSTPTLTATNTFTVTVNPVTQPSLGSAAYANAQPSFSVSGQIGPDYIIQVSTNLSDGWNTLSTTNPTAMPFTFTDTNAANASAQFYRILMGP